jgi:hypothetical protein
MFGKQPGCHVWKAVVEAAKKPDTLVKVLTPDAQTLYTTEEENCGDSHA